MEICSVGIAPVLSCKNDQPFELHALTYVFEPMGVL